MHRDVSVDNVRVDVDARQPSQGLLIDLDNAAKDPCPALRQTLPFLAKDLIHDADGYPHYHRHNLESFFYVLVWIGARYEDCVDVDDAMTERCVPTGDLARIRDAKFSSLRYAILFEPSWSSTFLRLPILKLLGLLGDGPPCLCTGVHAGKDKNRKPG